MKKFDQINMIPFIDIMLVLLAIVLTTASFVSKGLIEIDAPEADEAQAAQQDPVFVQVAINAEGQLYYEDQETDAAGLNDLFIGLDKTTQINLRIDKQVEFYRFIEVVNALKKYELDNFVIETTFPS